MNYIFQIKLKSVLLLENGFIDKPSGNNFLSTTLVYPRENIKSIETITALKVGKKKIEDNKEMNFTNVPFSEKLLFKESIQGNSSIKLMITAVEDVKKINNIIIDALKAGVLLGVGAFTGGIGISILTGVVKSFSGSLFDSWKKDEKKDKKISVLGSLEFPIDNSLKEGEIDFHLSTQKAIELKKTEIRNGQKVVKTLKIKKGIGIAKVVLEISKVPKFGVSPDPIFAALQ